MKTRPKERKSASNQSAIVKGFFKPSGSPSQKRSSLNESRRQSIQDILAKIKK